MNTQINKLFILLFTAVMVFTSCQKENIEEIDTTKGDLITATSEVAFLVVNMTARDGSFDNIMDLSHCTSIVLPVTVVVHGIEIIIESEEGLLLIERLFDEFEDDIDKLDFIFPIALVLADHTEVVIENADQLANIIAECPAVDDDIECIDFEYPITIAVYNDNNEQTGSETFENDEQLFHFFNNLNENQFVSFNFPMTLVDSTGERVVIENNEQLAAAIRIAKNECDEDDDNDYNDDDFTLEGLNAYLVACPWVVKDIKINADDLTQDYFEYKLDFKENGGVIATRVVPTNALVDGTWTTSWTDRGILLSLDFGANDILSNQWLVYDIGEGRIKFYDENSRVRLTQRCVDPNDGDVIAIKGFMLEGAWIVANYNDSGVDETNNYEIYTFSFFEGGLVKAYNPNQVVVAQGSWDVIRDASGALKFVLNLGAEIPFDEFLDEWDIVSTTLDRLELKDISGGDGTTDVLVFERLL